MNSIILCYIRFTFGWNPCGCLVSEHRDSRIWRPRVYLFTAIELISCLLLPACSSWRESNSYFAGNPGKPSMRTSCDKNVIAATWPAGRRQDRKQIHPEFFQLSDADLFKGETSVLLTCACMRVGKSGFLNVVEISSLIATGCSCFWQEVRALWPFHKSNSFANWYTKSASDFSVEFPKW